MKPLSRAEYLGKAAEKTLEQIDRDVRNTIGLTMRKEFQLPISYRKSLSDMFIFGANGSAAVLTNVGPPEPSLPPIQPLNPRRRITYEDET